MDKRGAMMDTRNRRAYLQELSVPGRNWDLIVAGGGASGLGVALDAASRGYSVLLLERSDFARGTSSRSTKLVHGGVRYLAQGDFKLVREASIERGILHRNAAHLVKDQVFLIPVYNKWDRFKYTIGLKVYDRTAGRLSLGRSRFISKDETVSRMPELRQAGLLGSILYHDGQFDDARLAINLVQTLWEHGGDAVNYLGITALTKNGQGMVTGVEALDAETGTSFSFSCSVFVNATGVFVDEILRMGAAEHVETIRVSQGIHLVLDKKFFNSPEALMIPATTDGRVLFAVPWHNKVIVGTTDTPLPSGSDEPVALASEIDFILDNLAAYLIKTPGLADLQSVFAGLRPLAAPKAGKEKTREISRSHKIIVSASGIFTMLGGKWTTYRKMGEDMVNRIEKVKGWKKRKTATIQMDIHGNTRTAAGPMAFYGTDTTALEHRINCSQLPWISEQYRIHEEMIRWSVDYEMARTVEDILARRSRLLFLDVHECRRITPEVARILATYLGHDEAWIREQVKVFDTIAARFLPAIV